ncbi:MAG: hypothetical protein HC822_26885 [Oscillochloris sp.]|nr:hypothetical protein [Oscillochloris sp.]
MTDLQAGHGTPLSLIRRACRLAMAAQPHLICLTGDFAADDATDLRPILAVLAELDAHLEVYAVPGNHDYKLGIERWHDQIEDAQTITDLTNAVVLRRFQGTWFCIGGVDSFSKGSPRLDLPGQQQQVGCTLLLAHNLDQAEHLNTLAQSVDLVLAGHTHGGQVRLPFVGALRNPARHRDIYESGLYHRPATQVYVSRGSGTVHLPIRFLCRPEVAILELAHADPDATG